MRFIVFVTMCLSLLVPSHPLQEKPKGETRQNPIVFSSNRDGRFQLYSCNTDGSDVKLLTKSETEDENPRWSPSGDRIAFVSGSTLTLLDCASGQRQSLDVTADPGQQTGGMGEGERHEGWLWTCVRSSRTADDPDGMHRWCDR